MTLRDSIEEDFFHTHPEMSLTYGKNRTFHTVCDTISLLSTEDVNAEPIIGSSREDAGYNCTHMVVFTNFVIYLVNY